MKKKREKHNVIKTSLLISPKEIKKVMIAWKLVFIVYPQKCLKSTSLNSSSLEDSSKCLESLLKEFQDVVQDPSKVYHLLEVLNIKLILFLDETKEIQKTCQEVIRKGLVQDNMSPCVMPIILVPKKDGC